MGRPVPEFCGGTQVCKTAVLQSSVGLDREDRRAHFDKMLVTCLVKKFTIIWMLGTKDRELVSAMPV